MENGAHITDNEILTKTVVALENNDEAADDAINQRLDELDEFEEECQQEERNSCEKLEDARDAESNALILLHIAEATLAAAYASENPAYIAAAKAFHAAAKSYYETCVENRKRMEKRYAMAQECLTRARHLAENTEQALRQEKREYREVLQQGRRRLRKNKKLTDSYLH